MDPDLEPPLDGFLWQVLFHRRPPLELHRGLINAVLFVRLVALEEGLLKGNKDGSHLCQEIVHGVITRGNVVVGEVEVPLDLQKPLPWNPGGNWEIVENGVDRPIVIQVRKLDETDQDGEPKVCLISVASVSHVGGGPSP